MEESSSLQCAVCAAAKGVWPIVAAVRGPRRPLVWTGVNSLQRFTTIGDVAEVYAVVQDLKQRIAAAKEDSQKFNSRESLFGVDVTEYGHINTITKAFEPYVNMWESVQSWIVNRKGWSTNQMLTLDAEQIDKDVADYSRKLTKSQKIFEKNGEGAVLVRRRACRVDGRLWCRRAALSRTPHSCTSHGVLLAAHVPVVGGPLALAAPWIAPRGAGLKKIAGICKKVKGEVRTFAPLCPLISALDSPGMRDRHWEELSSKLAIKFDQHGPEFSLNTLIEKGVPDHMEQAIKIGEIAMKEYQVHWSW